MFTTPGMVTECVNLVRLWISWCIWRRRLMWPRQISVGLISLTAQWVTDAGRFQASVWRRPHLWRLKRRTNTSSEAKDLRGPSERDRERTGGAVIENRDGEVKYERQHREHKTEGETERDWAGRGLQPLIKIVNVFSKKHVSQPSHVNEAMSFNTILLQTLLKRNNIGVIEECTVGVVYVLSQCTIKRGLKVKPIVN